MKLLALTLSTVDLEQMRQFYTGFLGFREVEPHWTTRLAVQAGHTCLNFIPADADWRGYYHFAFDVLPERFPAAVRWLRERATLIASLTGDTHFKHESWNADAIYFRDPAGNILELIARHPQTAAETSAQPGAQDVSTDRPFSAREVIGITEIGLAVSSVADSVAQIMQRMPGVKPYSGAGSDSFTSVGDIQGLLIVVHTGRIWFPDTGIPALPLPVEVEVEVSPQDTIQQRYLLQAPPYPFLINPAP